MAFDFPASPTVNQIFIGSNGAQYQWNGVTWNQVSGNPASLTAQARSRVVNGAMQISQENDVTGSPLTLWYAADQWHSNVLTSGVGGFKRLAAMTPKGSKYRLRTTVNTADASMTTNENVQMRQYIEGIRIVDFQWGTVTAKQIILRFGWNSPAGTYSVAVKNGANDRSYIAPFTVAAGQASADIEQTLIIPGDTAGTWATDTAIGLTLGFVIAAGPTFQGIAGWQSGNLLTVAGATNGMATASANYDVFDVGLYLDDQNTGVPPPWVMPDEAQELAACQRYYIKDPLGAYVFGGYSSAASTTWYPHQQFPVAMRIAPTMAYTLSGSANLVGTPTLGSASTLSARAQMVAAAIGAFYGVWNYSATARM